MSQLSSPLAPLVVVSGPSGVGKSTVVRAALELDPRIWLSVSATTRRPREGEVDGREYFFVDDAAFDELVATDGLLEWAQYAGNRYGTPRAAVQERRSAGTPVLLEIEVQGARQVRQAVPGALLVFLLTLSAYVTITLLGGPRSKLLVSLVYDSVVAFQWPQAAALAFVLLAMMIYSMRFKQGASGGHP